MLTAISLSTAMQCRLDTEGDMQHFGKRVVMMSHDFLKRVLLIQEEHVHLFGFMLPFIHYKLISNAAQV